MKIFGIEWSKVEAKVKAAGLMSLLLSSVVAALNFLEGNSALLGGLPPLVQLPLVALLPPLATFLTGWAAVHTPRPDLKK